MSGGKEDNDQRLLNVRQVARYLNVSEKWVYNKNLPIPVVRLGGNVRYDRHDVDRWIEENKQFEKK